MTATYDPSTTAGQARLLCQDTGPDLFVFSDQEMLAFLNLNQSDPRLAAAQALDVIAANEALVTKRTQLLDLMVDSAKAVVEVRAIASELRRQVFMGEADPSGQFDWAEFVTNPQTYVERLIDVARREES
ncbi:MAG TPA: hypothetical protein VF972_06740 [Actinomycetota bacterium]